MTARRVTARRAFAGGTASIPCGAGSYSTSNGACKICMFAYLHNEFPRFCSFISVSCGILGNIWKRLERTDTSWKMCAYLRSWDVLSETSPTGGSSISVCISCLPGSYSSTSYFDTSGTKMIFFSLSMLNTLYAVSVWKLECEKYQNPKW